MEDDDDDIDDHLGETDSMPRSTAHIDHRALRLVLTPRERILMSVLTAEIIRSYPMETSMGAGWRVTISEGLESQLDPV